MDITKRIREVIDDCEWELVTNFDLPAVSIITHNAARLGMDRESFEKVREAVQLADAKTMYASAVAALGREIPKGSEV